MPTFFLPRASDAEQGERLYQALAEFAGCEPDDPARRVRAVEFTADGARWTAEVGRTLRGERRSKLRRTGEVEELSTETVVLAIYSGESCSVVTDAAPITGASSPWANPFAVVAERVTLFDPT